MMHRNCRSLGNSLWPGKGRQIRQWNAVVATSRSIEFNPATEKPPCEQPSSQRKVLKVPVKMKAKAPPQKRSRGRKSIKSLSPPPLSLSLLASSCTSASLSVC